MLKNNSSYRILTQFLGVLGLVSLASCSSTQGFYDADGIYTDQPMKVDTQPVDYATYFDEMKQEADSYEYIINSDEYFTNAAPNSYGGWGEQTDDTHIYIHNNMNWGWNWGMGYYNGWGYPGWGFGWGYGWGWYSPYYWHSPFYWNYPRYAYRDVSRSAYHRGTSRSVYAQNTSAIRNTRSLRSRSLSSNRLVLPSREISTSSTRTVRKPISRNTINRTNSINRESRNQSIRTNTNRSRNYSPSRSINSGSSRSMGSGISRGSSRSR